MGKNLSFFFFFFGARFVVVSRLDIVECNTFKMCDLQYNKTYLNKNLFILFLLLK